MSSVVFLDVDGVLNTRRTCAQTPTGVHYGVDDARISILSNAMRENGVDGIVLTSTWKHLREDNEDYIYLMNCFEKFGIKMLGKTHEGRASEREEGVLSYLNEHPEIEEYVILDDNQFGFKRYSRLYESFIDTQARGIENGIAASKTPSVMTILFLDAIKKYSE